MANNNGDIELIASLNESSSEAEIIKGISILNSRLKASGKAKIKLDAEIDTTSIQKELNRLEALLKVKTQNGGSINISGNVDKKSITTSVHKSLKDAQSIAKKNSIQVTMNLKKDKLINDIKVFGQQNSKLFKDANMASKYNSLLDNAKLATSAKEVQNLRLQLSAMRSELKATNNAGLTFGDTLKKTFKRATELFTGTGGVMLISQQIYEAWNQAMNLDGAFTDLIKVQNELSRGDYPDYLDKCNKKAQDLASTQQALIEGATEFSKSGYDLKTSDKLTEKSTILSNVGEMSASDSAKSIISGVQAFSTVDGYTEVVEKAQALIDKYNAIGNTASITTAEIAQGVQEVGSVFADANTSVDEFIALLAAGNRQYQDADALALSLRTSALRIRGCTTELQLMNEETEGVYTSASKLQEKIAGLTNVNGDGGVKILEADDETFRSIYDIFLDISKVYKDMSDTDQSALLELIAGKHRASAISATLNNMSEAQEIYQRSLNATGSAQEEYDKWMQGSEASLNRFKSTMTETYQSLINGQTTKAILDSGTAVMQFANSLGLVESGLKGLIVVGLVKGFTTLSTAIKASAMQASNFGTALKTAQNMSDMKRNTQEYANALNVLKTTSVSLSETQLKQVLSSKALSEADRIAILRATGLSKAQSQAKLTQLGLTQSTKAQTKAQQMAITSTFSLSAAVKGLGVSLKAAFMSNPITITIMAISTAIGIAKSKFDEYKQSQEEARQTAVQLTSEYQEQKKSLDENVAKYKELKQQLDNSNLSTEEASSVKAQLLEIQNSLMESYGTEASNLDLVNGKYEEQIGLLGELSKEKANDYVAENYSEFQKAKKELEKERRYDLGALFSFDTRDGMTDAQEQLLEFAKSYSDLFTIKSVQDASTPSNTDFTPKIILRADVETAEETIRQFQKDFEDYVKLNGDIDIDVDAVRSGISDALTSITADEELADYKTIYDEYMKAEVLRNDTLRGLYSESIQAVEDYNKALASGEGIEEAKANLDSVKESVQGTTDILEGSQDVFDEIFNQQITVDTETAIENVNKAVDTIQQEVTDNPVEVTVEVDNASLTNLESQISSLTKSQSILNSALSEQYDNGTITSETLASLQEHYTDLEKAIEITTVGISINTSKLSELDKAKKQQIETDLVSNEKALADQYNENSVLLAAYTERLRSDTSLTEEQRTQLEGLIEAKKADQLATEGQIADLQYLQAEYNNATSTFNTFMNALNTADAGNSYDSVVSSINTIKEQFEKGLIGTDQFRSFVDYMTYADMSTASVDELVSAYDEALLKAEQFYTESSEGSINLLNALEQNQYAIHDMATDSWTINIDDMNKAAQDTGISVEALETQLQKLKDYGFDIDFSSTNDSFVDVNSNLESIRKRISEVKNALTNAQRVEGFGVDTSVLQDELNAELQELESSEASIVASIEPVMNKQKATEQILELQKQIDANPLNSQMVIEVQKQQQKIADENGLDLTSIITVNSDTSKAEEDAQGLKKSVDSMTMKPKIDITSEVANARSQIVNLVNGTYTAKIGLEVQGTSIITKVKNVIQTAVSKTSESGASSWTGSAFANGSWRVGHSGKALVGELGTELLVRDGKYQTIGENGAEFIDTKPSDIIFNHMQTSEILKNGHIDSRGRALMSGSAYVTGKGSNVSSSGSGKIPSSNNSTKSKTSSTKKNTSNNKDDKKAKTTIDWIKRKLEVLQKKIDETKAKFDNLFTLDEKKNNLNKQIKQTTNLLKANEKAAKKYKKYADKYAKKSGLSKSLQKKVQSGDYNIKDYDDKTAEKINKYKEYWDNYKEAKQQVDELTTSIRELKEEKYQLYVDDAEGKINKSNAQKDIAKGFLDQNKYLDEQKAYLKQSYDYQIKIAQLTNDTAKVAELQAEYQKELWDLEKEKFDNIEKYYQNQISLIELSEKKIQEQMDLLDAKGMTINAKYYKAEIGYQEGIRAEYQKSREELKKQLTVMENAGLRGTDQWYESVNALNEVDLAISECNVTIAEMNNSITEVANTIQNKLLSRLSDVTDEMDWIVGLMRGHDIVDNKTSSFTDEGLATLGSYVSGFNTSKYSAEVTRGLVTEMQKALDNNVLSFTYNDQEWIYNSKEQLEDAIIDANKTWRDQITESVDYSNQIIDMMIQKYQSELSVLEKLIDAKRKSLQSSKDLHNYQMSISEKVSNVDSLTKQLMAIQGDTSQEGMARKQKIQKQLNDAQADLKNTEYDRYISDQEAMLDSLYAEYEALINDTISDRDTLLQKGINAVNLSATKIQDTINGYAQEYNYTDVLNNIDASIMSMSGDSSALEQIKASVLTSIAPSGTIPTAIDGLKLSVETGLNNIATLIQQLLGSSTAPPPTTDSNGTVTLPDGSTRGTGYIPLDSTNMKLPTLEESTKTRAEDFINSKASKPNKEKKEYSDVNKKIWEFTKGKVLSTAELKDLAELVGVKYDNAKKSGKLYKKLKSLGIKGFSHGGVIEIANLNRQIKENGDDALVSVKEGERVLTPVQNQMFEKFIDGGLQDLVNASNMLQPIVNVPKLPDVKPNTANATQIMQIDNITLPNITNYEEFKGKMFKDMQHDIRFEKMVQSMTLPSLHGQRSRLAKYSIKF